MTLSNAIADATEDAILKLIFQAVAWANYADNAATTPQTNIGMSLHTADPGEAGDASITEVGYTNYTRMNVLRTTGGWTSTQATMTLAANLDFPLGGAGGTNLTAAYFAAAKSNATPPTGAQAILWRGDITPSITTGNGVTPRLTNASTITLN